MIKYNIIAHYLKKNYIVAMPTDTIYGFSCLPNTTAINKLYKLKKRQKTKGFIILTSELKYLRNYVNANILQLINNKYKNIGTPTTFIVPSLHHLAINNTLALRLTKDKYISYLCSRLTSAIISTSANIATKPEIDSILGLKKQFGSTIKYYLNPVANNNKSSAIIDLITHKQYR